MLTDALIRAMKPGDKLRYERDAKTDGLYVAVAPSGLKSFRWQRSVGGKSVVKTLGRFGDNDLSLADARDLANAINGDLRKGEAPAQPRIVKKAKAGMMTVAEAYDLYHAAKGGMKKTGDRKRQMYDNHIHPFVGGMALVDVTKADLKAIITAKAATAPMMANRALAEVKTFFKWCVVEDDVTGLTADPAASIAKPAEERVRKRVLSDQELEWFLAAIRGEERFHRPFLLLLLTGCRLSEVLEAKWSEVTDDRWLIGWDRAKNDCAHLVPLTPDIRKIFDDQRAHLAEVKAERIKKGLPIKETDLVFPGKRGTVMGNIDDSTKAVRAIINHFAGRTLEEWRNHDLRRTMGSAFGKITGDNGMPIVELWLIDELLNHKDGEARKGVRVHYNINAFIEPKRKALELWAGYLKPIRDRAAKLVLPDK